MAYGISCISISAIYTRHFPFISRCTSLATSSFAFSFPSAFFPGRCNHYIPSRYVSPLVATATVQRCIPSTAFRSNCLGRMRLLIVAIRRRSFPSSRRSSLGYLPSGFLNSSFYIKPTHTHANVLIISNLFTIVLSDCRNQFATYCNVNLSKVQIAVNENLRLPFERIEFITDQFEKVIIKETIS